MTNRNKHLPYYLSIIGIASFSIGFNILQYEENRVLQLERKSYKTFYEYLYLKYRELQLDILDGKFDQYKKNIS